MAGSSLTFANKTYTLDDTGCLEPTAQWDEDFARGLARLLGMGRLNERHWQVIYYLRQKAAENQPIPIAVVACADLNMRLSELRARFPTGYHRGACRLAGLNPRLILETDDWRGQDAPPVSQESYPLDASGFLADFDRWDEDFARQLAARSPHSHPLGPQHWQVIRYLRDYHQQYDTIPTIYEVCTDNHLTLDQLGELFPGGYRRGACRLAGLPFYA